MNGEIQQYNNEQPAYIGIDVMKDTTDVQALLKNIRQEVARTFTGDPTQPIPW